MQSTKIQHLIQLFSKLPGLGPRSGRRAVLHLLQSKEKHMQPLLNALQDATHSIQTCQQCYGLDTHSPCQICSDIKRDNQQLCVVESVADLWALERSAFFRGQYFVLGGSLSAVRGVGPEDLRLGALRQYLQAKPIKELVFALNATLDSQTTMYYVIEQLKGFPIKFSTLAHGVPLGGELDYLDDGTLNTAFQHRKDVA